MCEGVTYPILLKRGIYSTPWFDDDNRIDRAEILDEFIKKHLKNPNSEEYCVGSKCEDEEPNSVCLITGLEIHLIKGKIEFQKIEEEVGGFDSACFRLVVSRKSKVEVITTCDCIAPDDYL
jgi:hypothetical protein